LKIYFHDDFSIKWGTKTKHTPIYKEAA